jgi:glutathione S-transferase
VAHRDLAAVLYVIPTSSPARTGMLLLEHKGIEYRTRTMPTLTQPLLLRLRGFRGRTVPALVIDGRRVQTTRTIARALDQLVPEPPLFPADRAQRAAVEEAERWADEELQQDARKLVLASGLDWPGTLVDEGDDGRMGPLLWHGRRRRRVLIKAPMRFLGVTRETERELLAKLPHSLDRIDEWIRAGVLGGERLNAADYAIASNVALLTYRADLRPEIEGRPVAALVDRLLPAS